MPRVSRRVVLAAAAFAVLTSACQLRVDADVTVQRDGSGSFELAVAIDRELETELADAGFDPFAGLDGLRAVAPDWQIEQIEEVPGTTVILRTTFAGPDEFTRLASDLEAALDAADGSLFQDLRLEQDTLGATRFTGRAGLVLPEVLGAEGEGIRFDGEDVAALLAERGRELLTFDLRLTLPAVPDRHDADDLAGRTMLWRLPIGEQRDLSASAPEPSGTAVPIAVAAAFLAVAIGLLGTVMMRTRRRRRSRRATSRSFIPR